MRFKLGACDPARPRARAGVRDFHGTPPPALLALCQYSIATQWGACLRLVELTALEVFSSVCRPLRSLRAGTHPLDESLSRATLTGPRPCRVYVLK